jgi:hypothetical protein
MDSIQNSARTITTRAPKLAPPPSSQQPAAHHPTTHPSQLHTAHCCLSLSFNPCEASSQPCAADTCQQRLLQCLATQRMRDTHRSAVHIPDCQQPSRVTALGPGGATTSALTAFRFLITTLLLCENTWLRAAVCSPCPAKSDLTARVRTHRLGSDRSSSKVMTNAALLGRLKPRAAALP